MSETNSKNIMFYGKPSDGNLEQFTRDQMEKWIQLRSKELGSLNSYTVRIFFLKAKDENVFGWVGCEMSVRFGEVTFEGRALHTDSYHTVQSAIKKLKPIIGNTRTSLDALQA